MHFWDLCVLFQAFAFLPLGNFLPAPISFTSACFLVEGGQEGTQGLSSATEMQVDKGNYLNTDRAGLLGLEAWIKMQRSMWG